RLEQGRELLRRRLTRRGVTLAAALMAAELCDSGTFAGGVAQMDMSLLDGPAGVSPWAASLADQFIRSTAVTHVKRLCALFLAVGILSASVAVVAHAKRPEAPPASPQPPPEEN